MGEMLSPSESLFRAAWLRCLRELCRGCLALPEARSSWKSFMDLGQRAGVMTGTHVGSCTPTEQLGSPKLGSGLCCGTGQGGAVLPAPLGSALGEEKPACSGLPSAWSHLLHVSPAPGKAYSLGRAEYGRLGLGEGAEEKSTPTVIPDLPSISSVACGASVGYAVSSDGEWQAPPAHGALPTPPLPLLGGCPTTSTPPRGFITGCWGRIWARSQRSQPLPSTQPAGAEQQLLKYFCGHLAAGFGEEC